MLKLLLISSANTYMSNLKETAYRGNADIIASVSTLAELRRQSNLILKSGVDWVVCSEDLSEAEPYSKFYDECSKIGLADKFFMVLTQEYVENYALYMHIPYINSNDIEPEDLIRVLEKATSYSQISSQSVLQDSNMGYQPKQQVEAVNDDVSRHNMRQKTKERRQEMKKLNTPRRDENFKKYEQHNEVGGVHSDFSPTMVCVSSSKGGVGKTTTAIELASSIAYRAKCIEPAACAKFVHPWEIRVCLVDFNPSFDTLSEILKCTHNIPRDELPSLNDWFDLYKEKLLNAVPEEIAEQMRTANENGEWFDVEPYLEKYRITFTEEEIRHYTVRDEETGLFVIPAIQQALDVGRISPEYISYILEILHGYFDVVIVDTGNNISNFTINTIATVDKALIICEKSNGAAATVDKFLSTLDKIDIDTNSEKCYMVLSNAHGKGDDKLAKDYEHRFGMRKISDIPYDPNVITSHEKHEFYSINNPKTEYAKTIVKLAHWIYPLWIKMPTVQQKKKRKKFLGIF